MPHFPKHYEVGSHCHLVLWLTKFESEDPDANGEPIPVTDQWSLREIYLSPLLSGANGEGIMSMTKRRIMNAAVAVRKLSGNPYITAAGARAVQDAIAAYENSSSAKKNLSFAHFFVNQPTPGDDEHALFESLCYKGVYVPPFHRSPQAADTPGIERLLFGDSTRPAIWERAFPDPKGGKDVLLGDITFEVLFTTGAQLLFKRYPDTFADLKLAREFGIFRIHRDRPLSLCGSPDGVTSPVTISTTFNGKCCGPNGCQLSGTFTYCSEISEGVCSAVSDICPG